MDTENNVLSGIGIQSAGDWITTSAGPEPATYSALAGLLALGLAVWRGRICRGQVNFRLRVEPALRAGWNLRGARVPA